MTLQNTFSRGKKSSAVNLLIGSIIVIGCLNFNLSAQDTTGTGKNKAYILVVPFPAKMYQCTGEHFICKTSEMTPGTMSEMIRRSLTTTLIYNLTDRFNSKELEDKAETDRHSDLAVLYEITEFQQDNKRLRAYYKGYPPKKLFASHMTRWGTDCVNNTQSKPNKRRHKYAKAVIIRDSLYHDICARNSAEYVLYITEFEMNTRFKGCMDLQRNIYQRDFYVHFTLLNADAKYITGGVVATTFQSSSNDIRFILDKNLGMLSGLIIDILRNKI